MASDGAPADLVTSLRLDSHAPRAARHHVGQVDRPSPDLLDVVQLLTSELVSRAVDRCLFAGAMGILRVWMPPEVVRVELQVPRTSLGPPSLGVHEDDFSLQLVRHLADRWSLTDRSDLSCHWFEIDRQEPVIGTRRSLIETQPKHDDGVRVALLSPLQR
jgi:hypothetical protein